MSRYEISKRSGVSQAQLCRLMKGRTLATDTAEQLLAYFGYEIRKRRKGAKP